jgi:hypothetical protein
VRDTAEDETVLASKGFGLDRSPAKKLVAAGILALVLLVVALFTRRTLARRRRPRQMPRAAAEAQS